MDMPSTAVDNVLFSPIHFHVQKRDAYLHIKYFSYNIYQFCSWEISPADAWPLNKMPRKFVGPIWSSRVELQLTLMLEMVLSFNCQLTLMLEIALSFIRCINASVLQFLFNDLFLNLIDIKM